jgi:hypothetical protein
MSQSTENGYGGDGQQDWRPVWQWMKATGLLTVLAVGAVLIVVIVILAFSTNDSGVRATILAAGIPAALTFIVVVIQAAVSKQMADTMERQESEMTESRITMQKQLAAMENTVGEMSSQRALMQDQLKAVEQQSGLFNKQIDIMIRNECAYIGIISWEFTEPIENTIVILGKFVNGGRTPAWDFRRQFMVMGGPPVRNDVCLHPIFGSRADGKLALLTENSPPTMLVAGGETIFSTEPVKVDTEKMRKFKAGEFWIFVDGECLYSDTVGTRWLYKFGYTIRGAASLKSQDGALSDERYQTHQKYEPEN